MDRRSKGQQPLLGAEWRKRYKLLFQLVCVSFQMSLSSLLSELDAQANQGATIALDIAFAIPVALNSYDTPKCKPVVLGSYSHRP